jgi:hypothetical protein
LAALALIGCVVSPAQAQRVTTMDATRFLTLCTGREAAGCEAYIDGVADTIVTYRELTERPGSPVKVPPDVCIPAQVSGAALRERVIGWLRGHESERGKPLHQLVYRALLASWPCS